MDSLEYELVEPIGKRTVFGHVNHGDGYGVWGEIEIDDYPDSPAGAHLQKLRRTLGLHLFEAARALGLRSAQYSALERGAARCHWERAHSLLRTYAHERDSKASDPRGQVP